MIGVLAVQGDFEAHARALARAGFEAFAARSAADLARADALVLPGGESTAMLRGIARDGLGPALRAHLAARKPMLGTCAGAILLARVRPARLDMLDSTASATPTARSSTRSCVRPRSTTPPRSSRASSAC